MNRLLTLFLCFSGWLSAASILAPWHGPAPELDGRLQEPGWTGPSVTDLKQLESEQKNTEPASSFFLRYDSDALYVGVDCAEPNMASLDLQAPIWTGDGVEFICCPSGKPDEFYQFRVNATGLTYAMFYGEAGNITPDPYAPFWESAVSRRADGWSAEFRIPWHAFYMTPARNWSGTWFVNFARERRTPRRCSSWAPQRNGFNETTKFPKVEGFPVKTPARDFAIQPATARITRKSPMGYEGTLETQITAGVGGTLILTGATKEPVTLPLKEGVNAIAIPGVLFSETGRNPLTLTLLDQGKVVAGRSCQVMVEFDPLTVELTTPGYRGNFYPGQESQAIRGCATSAIDHPVTLELQLDQRPSRKFSFQGTKATFALETPALEAGKHILTARVTAQDGSSAEKSVVIQKFTEVPANQTGAWVENGTILINGTPRIPRFIYAHSWHGGKAFDERTAADDIGITGVLQKYQVSIDPSRLAAKVMKNENLTKDVKPGKEVFEVIRRRIEHYRGRPFLYYLLFDEPECTSTSPVYLRYLYDFVKELDPWHPVLIPTRDPRQFIDCADILVPHPYINPSFDGQGNRSLSKPMVKLRDYIKAIQGRPDKVMGLTGQFFSYKSNSVFADYPTLEELEAQVWTTIANGGRWFNNYAYHDLGDRPAIYEGTRYLFTSLRALESFFATAKSLPIEASSASKQFFDAVLFQQGDSMMLLVVNLMPESQTIRVSSTQLKKSSQWHLFRGEKTLPGRRSDLEFTLGPHESLILTSRPMDQGLSPRSQCVKAIADQEKRRLSRPNILLEKGLDIEISSSVSTRSPLNMQNKLFDGTLDVWAWAHQDFNTRPYIELSFPKFVPRFRKLRLFGTPLSQDIALTIRKRGKWKPCTPSKVTTGKYMIEFEFPEELSTIRLRLDFPLLSNSILELYELELDLNP